MMGQSPELRFFCGEAAEDMVVPGAVERQRDLGAWACVGFAPDQRDRGSGHLAGARKGSREPLGRGEAAAGPIAGVGLSREGGVGQGSASPARVADRCAHWIVAPECVADSAA